MRIFRKYGHIEIICLSLPVAALFVYGVANLNAGLWWDEIISLRGYALVPILQTVTTYNEPNNHILFNVLYNFYTAILGQRDFYAWIDHVYILRIPQLLFSLMTMGYLIVIGRKFFGPVAASLSAIITISTIPFLNFILQLRGYSISMLFIAFLLFHAWSFIQKKLIGHFLMIVGSALALLYTIPSNAYFFISFSVICLYHWTKRAAITLRSGRKPRSLIMKELITDEYGLVLLALGTAGVAAIWLYLPVLDKVLDNQWVTKPVERFSVLLSLFPSVIVSFVSYRFALLLLLLAAAGMTARGIIIKNRMWLDALSFLCIPFLISFIRNDNPPDRVFVPLIPVFVIALSGGISLLFDRFKSRGKMRWIALSSIALYCALTLAWQLRVNQEVLHKNALNNTKEQTIYRSYYCADDFNPLKTISLLAQEYAKRPAPIVLIYEIDRLAALSILEKYRLGALLPAYPPSSLQDKGKKTSVLILYGAKRNQLLYSFELDGGGEIDSMELVTQGDFFTLFGFLYQRGRSDYYYILTAAPSKLESLVARYSPDCALHAFAMGQSYLHIYSMRVSWKNSISYTDILK